MGSSSLSPSHYHSCWGGPTFEPFAVLEFGFLPLPLSSPVPLWVINPSHFVLHSLTSKYRPPPPLTAQRSQMYCRRSEHVRQPLHCQTPPKHRVLLISRGQTVQTFLDPCHRLFSRVLWTRNFAYTSLRLTAVSCLV